MDSATYDQQLKYLEFLTRGARADGYVAQVFLLLSLTESVKLARDHSLNCADAQPLRKRNVSAH